MAENNGFYEVDGVLHSVKERTVTSKKDGKEYLFVEFFLEKSSQAGERTYTDVIKFSTTDKTKHKALECGVGGKIHLTFVLKGNFFKGKFGDSHKNELKCVQFDILQPGALPEQQQSPFDEAGTDNQSDDLPF